MKKVLIITYKWPPCGGIGVLRCLKIAKYLREFGWEPVIFTADNAHYPKIDPSMQKDVPDGVEVLKQKIWEPYSIYKKLMKKDADENVQHALQVRDLDKPLLYKFSVWVRSNFFIPDARAFWIRPSVKHLTAYLKENPVDAIFSDGPPHTNTRIACLISRKFDIPWLADYQDPWTQVDYFKELILTSWGRKKHERQEQEAFQQASANTIVSHHWKKDLEEIGASNVSVIPWGFDPEDYDEPREIDQKKFTILHAGLMSYDRNPDKLIRVIAEIAREDNEFREDCVVEFFGDMDQSIKDTIQSMKLTDVFSIKGSVSRDEILNKMKSTSILLLLLNKQENALGRIPGKLFEYMAVKRPILALGDYGSDVDSILNTSKSGQLIAYDDEAKLKSYIQAKYLDFKNGEINQPVQSNIQEYSIKHLTGKIAQILNEIS